MSIEYEKNLSSKSSKNLIASINKFTLKEKLHVLRILKTHNIDYSKNSYGYFFNLNEIDDNIFNKLWKCIDLIECNRDIIKQLDKKREDLINYYTDLIETNLKKTRNDKLNNYIDSLKVKDIQYNISSYIRKKNVKKEINTNVDPDILIRDYMKKMSKYSKTSVYYRLTNLMKHSRSNKIYDVADENEGDDNTSEYNFDENANEEYEVEKEIEEQDNEVDLEIEEDNEVDVDIEQDNEVDVDIEEENEVEIEIEHENEKNNKKVDISKITETINEIEENEVEIEEDNETELENDKEDIYKYNLNFYKKLLNKQGFVFNENLKCILEYQPYIN